jgi:hypothetical protein
MRSNNLQNRMDWFNENWGNLLAAIGAGGGSSIIGTKMIDKEQNKRLTKLEDKVNVIDSSLKVNEASDKQFRMELNTRLGNIEGMMSKVLDNLLSKKR